MAVVMHERSPTRMHRITRVASSAMLSKKYALDSSFGRTPRPWFMIDPRDHVRHLRIWDAVVGLGALPWVVTVTPFETAFLELELNAIFAINRVVDLIFIIDFILQFLLMVKMSTADGLRWVSSPRAVALHYLRGWFMIDALSIGAAAIDYFIVAGSDVVAGLGNLSAPRVLRVLRLIKLLKVLTAFRVFRRWEIKTAVNYGEAAAEEGSLTSCC